MLRQTLAAGFGLLLMSGWAQAQDAEPMTLRQAIDAHTENHHPEVDFLVAFLDFVIFVAIVEGSESEDDGTYQLNGTEFQSGMLYYGFDSVEALSAWQATWSDAEIPFAAATTGREIVETALLSDEPVYLVINYGTDQILMVPEHFELYRAP